MIGLEKIIIFMWLLTEPSSVEQVVINNFSLSQKKMYLKQSSLECMAFPYPRFLESLYRLLSTNKPVRIYA